MVAAIELTGVIETMTSTPTILFPPYLLNLLHTCKNSQAAGGTG